MQMNFFTRQKQGLTDLENKLREGIVREFGMDMYTLLYLKERTNKDLL